MPLPEFTAVRLTTDRYLSEGVGRGSLGFILDIEDTGYVVEFSRSDGMTIALIFLEPADLEPAPEVMPSSEHLTV